MVRSVILFFLVLLNLKVFSQTSNVNVSKSIVFDGEPYMAVNPGNPNNIVVAWMGFAAGNKTVSLKTKTSFDGGKTWGNLCVQPHFSANNQSADPGMAWHRNGKLYLSYIDNTESPAQGGDYITTSTDGGITWTVPIKYFDASESAKLAIDRPWLVVDNSGTATDGMLYVTTKPAPWVQAPCRPYLKYSTDGGKSWSNFQFLDSIDYLVGPYIQAPMATPVVGADGGFYAIYPSYLPSQSTFPQSILAKSTDGGKTITRNIAVTNLTSVKDSGAKLGYKLCANPTDKNQLALCFVDARNGDADIFIASTNDGGKSWNSPVKVNDDATGKGITQDMPWASYNEKGELSVTWRDRRNSSGTGIEQDFDVYGAISGDNGQSFGPNVKLTDTTNPFMKLLLNSGNDFLSSFSRNDSVFAVWGDIRSGKLNIYFSKTSVKSGHSSSVEIINEAFQDISVSPNPATNSIMMRFLNEKQIPVSIQIIDGQGKEIRTINPQNQGSEWMNIAFDVSGIKPGAYICKIMMGNEIKTTRIVVE